VLFDGEGADDKGKHDPTMKDMWSDQKGNNMIMVLELIRVLVVPDHSNTISNQVLQSVISFQKPTHAQRG